MWCTYYYNFCRDRIHLSPGPSSDTNGTFTLEDDNVCLLKVHNGYHLYVNGKYVGALDTIPDDFKNVTIYTRKEEIPHE